MGTPEPSAGPTSEMAPAPVPTALPEVPSLGPSPSAVPEPTVPPPTLQPVVTSPTIVISPTLVPAPTIASSPTAVVTSSPTTTDGISVDATPFSATYNDVSADPSQEYCDAASDVTIAYLTTSFEDFFDANPFVDLQGVRIEAAGCAGAPPQVAYTATAVFAASSDPSAIPQTADLDTLLEVAFEPPMVAELMTLLAALPADNPFAATSSVTYGTAAEAAVAAQVRESAAASAEGGVAQDQVTLGFAASLGALALVATALQRRRRRWTAARPGWVALPETDTELCR